MTDYFDICGTPIKYSEIKSFRLVQREYIYRPTYMEGEKQLFSRNRKYNFFGMQPYAAIYDENEKHSALKEYKTKDFKESVGKDFIEGVITTIGDKWHIKAITSRKYVCVNQAGRKFTTYLEDIPALLMRQDGKASDIHKNDELYPLLGEPIAPAINIVHALQITAKETYVFFGNDIHLHDVGAEYERLKAELNQYNEERKVSKSLKPKISIPKFPELKFKKDKPKELPEEASAQNKLAEIKAKFSNGEITEEEYQELINQVMETI